MLQKQALLVTEFGSDPVFQHPWEARAFAMIVSLSEQGLFAWSEWVECLSERIAAAEQRGSEDGRCPSYSEHWVGAAEDLLIRKGITSFEQLRARRLGAWPIDVAHTDLRGPR